MKRLLLAPPAASGRCGGFTDSAISMRTASHSPGIIGGAFPYALVCSTFGCRGHLACTLTDQLVLPPERTRTGHSSWHASDRLTYADAFSFSNDRRSGGQLDIKLEPFGTTQVAQYWDGTPDPMGSRLPRGIRVALDTCEGDKCFRHRASWVLCGMLLLVFTSAIGAEAQTALLQQQQLDALQARLDAKEPDAWMQVFLDGAALQYDRVFVAWGWAFKCGEEPQRMVVFVDGIPTEPLNAAKWQRADVLSYYSGYCPAGGLPAEPGILFYANLRSVTEGPHRLKVRLYDQKGRMRESNTVTVVVPQ